MFILAVTLGIIFVFCAGMFVGVWLMIKDLSFPR